MTRLRVPGAEIPVDTTPLNATPEDVAETLNKVLAGGRLGRMPTHPQRRDIILAILSLDLHRRYPYTEVELNHTLKSALARMNAAVDHVTCRRYMVDVGFLKRDRAGIRYFLNYPRLATTLSEEAMAAAGQLVDQALVRRRQNRRRP